MFTKAPSPLDSVPKHVRASWTPEQAAYYKATLDQPRLGPEYSKARRKLEMTGADIERRDFFLGYWPDTALSNLEEFKRRHYDALPDKDTSSVADRIRHYYPELIEKMDTRMAPLEQALDTHPELLPYWNAYQHLRAIYWRGLDGAALLTASIDSAKVKKQRHHELCRLAFEGLYPPLRELLEDLCKFR